MINIALRQDKGDTSCSLVLADELILGEELAAFIMALAQQVAVGGAVISKYGIVAGGTQVAAQAAQHFIAEEAGWGLMLFMPLFHDAVSRLEAQPNLQTLASIHRQ